NIHTIDSLRELNAKLLTEIAKLRKENDKIPELEKKFAEVEAENAKLKQIIEKNAMRDVRVKELEQKNTELEARLAIVEQASFVVNGQTQNGKEAIAEVWLSIDNLVSTVNLSNSVVDQQNNVDTKSIAGIAKISDKKIDDFVPEEPIPKVSPVNLPQPCKRYPKSLEEKEMDSFLDSENKKMVSNLMRERNREKKLRTQELMSSTSFEEESSTLEESSIYNSHRIEKEKQNEISVEHLANVVSDDSNSWSLCDKKTKIPYNQKVEQGLRHKLSIFTNDDDIEKHSSFDIQIPEFSLEMILIGSNKIAMQSIADLFNVAIKVGQKENLCWYCFYKAYEDQVEDYKGMKNIDDQSARTLVYNEIKFLLPNITDVNLRQKIFRAKKIYTLFTGIEIDKIKQITYSTYAISCLSDVQIQSIINSFPKQPTDTDECQKVIVGVTKSNAHVIKSSEVSVPTAPNSLGDSKVIGPDNSPKANDYDDLMPSLIEKGTNEVQTDYD
ncbi:1645_t:CDS:1, partial [Cetraspora pellucida]